MRLTNALSGVHLCIQGQGVSSGLLGPPDRRERGRHGGDQGAPTPAVPGRGLLCRLGLDLGSGGIAAWYSSPSRI